MLTQVAQRVKNLPSMQKSWVQPLGQEDPLEKGMAPHSIFLPGKSHGQRSLAGHKESDTTEQLHVTRIFLVPGTELALGLQS